MIRRIAFTVLDTAEEIDPHGGRGSTLERVRALIDVLTENAVPRGTWAKVLSGDNARGVATSLQKSQFRSELEVALRGQDLWVRQPPEPPPADEPGEGQPVPLAAVAAARTGASKTPADHVRDVVAAAPPGDPAGDGMLTEDEDLADFADKFRSIPGDMTDRTRGAAKLMGITPARAIRLRTLAAKAGLLAGVAS